MVFFDNLENLEKIFNNFRKATGFWKPNKEAIIFNNLRNVLEYCFSKIVISHKI